MFKQCFLCILILLNAIYIFGGEKQTNATVYSKAEMDRLAEEFKTQTGFVGAVYYDLNKGSFSKLEGKFVNVSASDTTSAKVTAMRMLSTLQSYMKINSAQLEHWEILPDMTWSNEYVVVGYQRINGLEFEDEPRIAFVISKNNPGFLRVSTNFVPDLSFSTTNLITEARAKEIYYNQAGKSIYHIQFSKLLICPISKPGDNSPYTYRPCWIISAHEKDHVTQVYYIDAETGIILMVKEPQINP